MTSKQISKIAIIACIQFVAFTSFSHILYVEVITLVVAINGCVFKKKEAVLASIIFAIINMFVQGVSIFSMMYLVIYPTYSMLFSTLKSILLKYPYLLYFLIGFCSLLTGQLLDLSFILFSVEVTIFYIILGLKTSLIQGGISFVSAMFLFEPLYNVLNKIERKY